jgi:hypothetical protein
MKLFAHHSQILAEYRTCRLVLEASVRTTQV